MSALYFSIGFASGMVFLTVVGTLCIAFSKRMTKEHSDAVELTASLLREANEHRKTSADALNAIRWNVDTIADRLKR